MNLPPKRTLAVSSALVAAVSGSVQAGVSNLVADGTFSNPPTVANSYTVFATGAQIGAWQSEGGEVLLVNSTYTQSGMTFQSQSGDQFLDLSGGPNPSPNTRVMQSIATEAGRQYELSFYIGSAWTGTGGTFLPPSVRVTAGATSPQTFTNSNLATGGTLNWELFSFVFTASSSATEISFQYGNTGPTNWNVGIDTVSVTLVPGPGGLTAVLATLVFRGKFRRRSGY